MAKKFIKTIPKAPKLKKISFHPVYHINLQEVVLFSVEMFGKRVAKEFFEEIKQSIIRLRTMPNMYVKCRFVDSTEQKTFRNIIVRSYYIVYVITATEITVLDIIHQSVSPENIKKRIEEL